MPGSGCSALHGVNPNYKKEKETQSTSKRYKQRINACNMASNKMEGIGACQKMRKKE